MAFAGLDKESLEINGDHNYEESPWRTVKKQLYLFLNISGPAMICNVVSQVQWLISSSFAGRELGVEALGAISITILAALVVRSFMIGIHSGFLTLAGNAFGEKNYSEIGFLLQSTLILCGSLVPPMALFYLHIDGFLSLLSQPEKVVVLASQYLKVFIFIFPIETGYEILKKYYQCQNVTLPFVGIKIIATIFHYFAVHSLRDVMRAFLLTEWLTFFLATQVYRLQLHPSQSWPGWNWSEAARIDRLKRILRLGIPGILSLSEWWFYEFQTVLVGTIGATALAAHAIAYFMIPFYFHIPYGFGTAAQTRIAVLVGERNISFARKISKGTLAFYFFIGFLSASSSYLYRDQIFSLFIEDSPEVIELASKVWTLVSVYMIADSSLASAMGILRGLGQHVLLAKIVTLCLWILGVPLECFFLYVLEWGLLGLWIGMLIIYILMCGAFVYYICKDEVYHVKYSALSTEDI